MTKDRVWVYNNSEVCSFLMDDAADTPSHSCHPACLCSAYTVLSAEPDKYVQTNWSIPLNNSWLSLRAWQQDTNYQDSSPVLSIIISGGWSISETIAHLPHSVVASCERLSLASVVSMLGQRQRRWPVLKQRWADAHYWGEAMTSRHLIEWWLYHFTFSFVIIWRSATKKDIN